MKKRYGFTLVELMIVIAIIGILAAALFPMLTGYMGRSRDTARLSHLGQIASATQNYFTDAGVYAPPNGGCVNTGSLRNYISHVPKDPAETSPSTCINSPGIYAYEIGLDGNFSPVFAVAAKLETAGGMVFNLTPSFTGFQFSQYTTRTKGYLNNTGVYVISR